MKYVLFWGSLGLVLYNHIGFPILLLLRGLMFRHSVKKADILPRLSLVIVAHNERATIGDKIESVLNADYPRDKVQVIIASDGSDDGMNEIVAGYADRGVQLLDLPRAGKIPTLNTAITHVTGEIILFSDANSIYAPDALKQIVRPFADPSVGAVGGSQLYVSGDPGHAASSGERPYWGFDRWLEARQADAGSITAATGAIHAIRTELFRPVPLGVSDDFAISTQAIAQGYRLVFEPKAIAYETLAPSDKAEYQRKVRVILRGLRGLWMAKELFNPIRHGFYALQLFSHKALRWTMGWWLLLLFAASLSLARAAFFYRLIAVAQTAFYSMALAAWIPRGTRLAQTKGFKVLAIPFYFSLANAATVHAWLRLLGGQRIDLWDSNRQTGQAEQMSELRTAEQ